MNRNHTRTHVPGGIHHNHTHGGDPQGILFETRPPLLHHRLSSLVNLWRQPGADWICVGHHIPSKLAEFRARRYVETLSEDEGPELITQGMDTLRRDSSMTLQDALPCRTRRCLEKQAATCLGRVDTQVSPKTRRCFAHGSRRQLHRVAGRRGWGKEVPACGVES